MASAVIVLLLPSMGRGLIRCLNYGIFPSIPVTRAFPLHKEDE